MTYSKILIYSLIFLCGLLLTTTCFAQPVSYTSTNKSAIKSYEEATKYYDQYQYEKALAELEKSVAKDPAFVEAHILMADIFIQKEQYEGAITAFEKAIAINPNFFPNTYFSLANIELNIAKYEQAKKHYEKFLTFQGTNPVFRTKAEKRIQSCEFAINALNNPVDYQLHNLGENINGVYDDYLPSLTVDNQTMFYTKNQPVTGDSKWFQEDFYISLRKDSTWSKSFNAGPQLNTAGNEGVPNISTDGKILFFAACNRPDGKGSCDIYYSRLKKEGWTRPINLGNPVNTGAWESQPSFSSDGRTLYFIRGTVSGTGRSREQDIYVTRINDEGRWSEPQKLTPLINTDEEEEFVFIHPDNQTLYFSSDGHTGMGKLDIYLSRKDAKGNWTQPENLGYPINTHLDERGIMVGPSGDIAYIGSNREGGIGGIDLYSFELYPAARPARVSYVRGIVTDIKTGIPLEANFEIIDLETGTSMVKSSSEKTSGEFLASLAAGKNYGLNVSKNGYLFYSDHFSFKNPADIKNAYVLDVKLQPAEKGGKVVLKNVFFDTNLFELKPESFSELDKLVAFMKSNTAVTVEVSGHTDSTGDKNKNKILSENRAKSVYNYLTGKGIPATRLSFKGYGDSQPVAGNETEEGRAQNRRTEFLITGTQ
ncbi:MAG: OmpA family protein [Bacteroidota bacterium]|nr:OmpA family protein [Bacteroidota bacterium]